MYQLFSKPDKYLGLCGHLDCEVTRWRIPGALEFMRGVRLLFAADFHVTQRAADGDIDALLQKIEGTKPDLILLGGDFADRAEHARRLFDRWAGLSAPLGCFAVVGNNDAEAWPGQSELRQALDQAGIRLLVNESVSIDVNGGRLIVAGVDEYRYGAPDTCGLYPAGPSGNIYRLLMSHYPILPEVLPDLMLSGHTHGGQFNLLGLTPFTIGFERLVSPRPHSRYIAGLHQRGGAQVLVTKGIGASRIPLRVCVRPEICLIEFD